MKKKCMLYCDIQHTCPWMMLIVNCEVYLMSMPAPLVERRDMNKITCDPCREGHRTGKVLWRYRILAFEICASSAYSWTIDTRWSCFITLSVFSSLPCLLQDFVKPTFTCLALHVAQPRRDFLWAVLAIPNRLVWGERELERMTDVTMKSLAEERVCYGIFAMSWQNGSKQ